MPKFQVSHSDRFASVEAEDYATAAKIAHKLFNETDAVAYADRLIFQHDPDDHTVIVQSEGGTIGFIYWVYNEEGK